MKTLLRGIITVLPILTCRVMAEDEVMIHDGPEVITAIGSMPKTHVPREEIVFRKQFFADSAALEKLPPSASSAAITGTKALDLAKATVDLGERKDFKLVRQELLRCASPRPADYYLIEMQVNGSTEHRVVLMDGTVIKPRLKRVTK